MQFFTPLIIGAVLALSASTLAFAQPPEGKGKNKVKDKKEWVKKKKDRADDARETAEDQAERAREDAEERAERAKEDSQEAKERSYEHRQDEDHRVDGRERAKEAKERSYEHRRDGENRADNERGRSDEEYKSRGKSEKDIANAKGKGKKKGWFGRTWDRIRGRG